jgi:hypothetical protein
LARPFPVSHGLNAQVHHCGMLASAIAPGKWDVLMPLAIVGALLTA